MINKRNTAILGASKGEPVELTFDPRVQDIVVIRVGTEESIVNMKDLYQFVFQCSDENDQMGLIPHRKEEVRKFKKQHVVRAQKDIKKGDEMVVNCEVDIAETVVKGMMNQTGA